MLVKCKGCESKIDRDTAYKVTIKGKNSYYCSEKEFLEIEQEKTARIAILEITKEILGDTTNTILFKELSDISKIHSYWKIYNYLKDNLNSIKNIMNKSFTKEYAKIKYFSTIIKNNLGDFEVREEKNTNTMSNIEFVEVRYKAKSRKKCLNQYIDEYIKEE